jgi:hypothetical protein
MSVNRAAGCPKGHSIVREQQTQQSYAQPAETVKVIILVAFQGMCCKLTRGITINNK